MRAYKAARQEKVTGRQLMQRVADVAAVKARGGVGGGGDSSAPSVPPSPSEFADRMDDYVDPLYPMPAPPARRFAEPRYPDDASIRHPPPDLPRNINRMTEAMCRFPMDAVLKLDAWYKSFRGVDVKAGSALVEDEHQEAVNKWVSDTAGDAYVALLWPRLQTATEVSRLWRDLRVALESGGLAHPTIEVDGVAREFAPEGAALEAFLAHAEAHQWYGREGTVFVPCYVGATLALKPVAAALVDVAATASQYVGDYLGDRPALVEGLVASLNSGAHSRFPAVELNTTLVAFRDGVVRLTSTGLTADSADKYRISRARPVTARAFVDSNFEEAMTATPGATAAVVQAFGGPGKEHVLRVCGALLLPPVVRTDRWRLLLVATGSVEKTAHPLELVCRHLVGQGVTEAVNLDGFSRATTATCVPYCLFVRANSRGALDTAQVLQLEAALESGMSAVVVAPFVPVAIADNPRLRLHAVNVPHTPTPEDGALWEAALPHVLTVCQSEYNRLAPCRRDEWSPLYDRGSVAARVNTSVLLSPAALVAEMLQAGAGVRVAGNSASCTLDQVRRAFFEYQLVRGYPGMVTAELTPTHVMEGYQLACSAVSAFRASPVTWNAAVGVFYNLCSSSDRW